jgi:thiosulfate reductase cytochrome b subunit
MATDQAVAAAMAVDAKGAGTLAAPGTSARRGHSPLVRVTHWITTASIAALVASGFAILLAHPRLYWGEAGNFDMASWVDLPLPLVYDHSGWGRSLHFLSAWVVVLTGVVYVVSGLAQSHFRRHFLPARGELRPRALFGEMADHVRLRVRKGRAGPRYGVLQKLAYLGVVFAVLPLVVLTGLTMSPMVTASHPWLFTMFGGRQSARTIHFILSCSLVLFVAVHVVMVAASGFGRQLRGMTIGEKGSGR